MGKFESFIKESLDNYQADYNPSSWDALEKHLPKDKNTTWYWLGAAAVATTLIGALVLSQSNKEVIKTTTPTQEIIERTPTQAPNPQNPKDEQVHSPVVEEKSNDILTKDTNNASPVVVESLPLKPQLKAIADEPIETNKLIAEGITAFMKVSKSKACLNEPILFEASVNAPCSYIWRFGDGGSSNLPTPVHQYKKTGKYKYSLTVTNLLDGTKHNIFGEQEITVLPKPQGTINYSVNQPVDFAQTVDFEITGKDVVNAEWTLNSKHLSGVQNSLVINQQGNYPAHVIIYNEVGCADTLRSTITVNSNYNLLAPTAFTPNGDGQNDIFIPKALENTNLKYTMDIIDPSSGQVIFHSDQSSEGWNGINNRTGGTAANRSYTWITTVYMNDGNTKVFKGSINIVE